MEIQFLYFTETQFETGILVLQRVPRDKLQDEKRAFTLSK